MHCQYSRCGLAGLVTAIVFGSLLISLGPGGQESAGVQTTPAQRKTNAKPIPMSGRLAAFEMFLGLKDESPRQWDGAIKVSEGTVSNLQIQRGGAKARVEGARFFGRTVRRMQQMKEVIVPPIVQVSLDAPLTAKVTVTTANGEFSFVLKDLANAKVQTFLDGQASVERQEGALLLTGKETEDDFPAMTRGPDGTIWLAYVEYQPGRPLVRERVLAGGFEELEPKGHGDRVRLMRFDGTQWLPALDVTEGGLDVWRPTVTVDGKGSVCVAWAQQENNNWDIYYRCFKPSPEPTWTEIKRLTNEPGADFHVVATTDASGTVWLAWQAWRRDNFEIMLAALADGHAWQTPRVISNSVANDWTPAITADSRGQVYVAWDTYGKGNYDVHVYTVGKNERDGKTFIAADKPHFEARPSIVCDSKDRLWIAYEVGDEQWGKDFATAQFKRIGFTKNPGFGLYNHRTIKVKCLVDGKWMLPTGDVQQAFVTLKRNKSLPRLCVAKDDSIWLFFRHHPRPGGAGETWSSFATRYDGKSWSSPLILSRSSNLLDNRPGVVQFGEGVLTVYSSDGRFNTQQRGQDDLFAAVLQPLGPAQAIDLVAAPPEPPPTLETVHPNEGAEIARMRGYLIDYQGKKLHLLRGEFHRHTEYSAHNDQDGSLEDAWRYGIDAGGLDWIGVGDHDNGFHSEYMWWHFQKVTDLFQHPPQFLAVYTYERSVVYPDGHRNVIMPRRGIRPLIRGDLKSTAEKGTPDTKLLYAYLKHFGSICASHTSATNMGTDWRDNDPNVEPIVEIYQGHRHNYEHEKAPRSPSQETQIGGYQPKGYVWNALEKGYRFGFQSSSDHMSTHMSYAVVLTDDVSRQGLIDAFKRRHCYAATDNIILDVRSGGHLMGEEFDTNKKPTIDIVVQGTAPIAKLHVIRDNKYVYAAEPNNKEVKLTYTDMTPNEGKTSYYYVRIEQADGNIAWGSPMWIKYKQ